MTGHVSARQVLHLLTQGRDLVLGHPTSLLVPSPLAAAGETTDLLIAAQRDLELALQEHGSCFAADSEVGQNNESVPATS